MAIERIVAIYFSATGNSEKIVVDLAKKISKSLNVPMENIGFTLPDCRNKIHEFKSTDLVIFGVPVYAGRIPNKVLPFVQNDFRGNGALAIPVVTYGNRSFGDALIELRNELENNEFHTIAGAAFVAQHSMIPSLAQGRPDNEDIQLLNDFALKIKDKILAPGTINSPVGVPGNEQVGPYYKPLGADGKPAFFLKAKPKTDSAQCDHCGICAQVCPMGAINPNNISEVSGICIKCFACIRKCPKDAKYFDDPALLSHLEMIKGHCITRSESVTFI